MNRDLEGPDLNPVIVSLLHINTVESSLFMRDQFNVCGFRGQPLLMNLHHRKPIYTIICYLKLARLHYQRTRKILATERH